jgi:hypothetical protein
LADCDLSRLPWVLAPIFACLKNSFSEGFFCCFSFSPLPLLDCPNVLKKFNRVISGLDVSEEVISGLEVLEKISYR